MEHKEFQKNFKYVIDNLKLYLNYVDYTYSGDKDTYQLAFSIVMRKYGLKEYHEQTIDEIRLNSQMHSDEIEAHFIDLREFGDIEKVKVKNVIEFLMEYIGNEEQSPNN